MRALIAGVALLLLSAPSEVVKPMAAWAIGVRENGRNELKAIIVQLDENRAVIGDKNQTFGIKTDGGNLDVGVLDKMSLPDLYQLGSLAPLKRSVTVVCGNGDPQT